MDPTAVSKNACSATAALSSRGSGHIKSRQTCSRKGCGGVVDYGDLRMYPARTRNVILQNMKGCGDACGSDECEEKAPTTGGASEEVAARNR